MDYDQRLLISLLTRYRDETGLKWIAQQVGISMASVSTHMKKKRNPDPYVLLRYCSMLGIHRETITPGTLANEKANIIENDRGYLQRLKKRTVKPKQTQDHADLPLQEQQPLVRAH